MRLIGRSLLAAVLASLPACGSVANPRSCIDGTCTSDEFPFCDVDGAFGADPNTCIAVTCEPGVFAQCRDDVAVTCNASGTDYDLVSCPLGCQDGVGCRACQPNETVCANGAVQTCDATGNVTSSETCALGCFESEPRCRDIAPSNSLAACMDSVPNPPDVDLRPGATINPDVGSVTTSAGAVLVPTCYLSAPAGGVPIRVFVGRNITLGTIDVPRTAIVGERFVPAIAFVATSNIRVEGRVNLTNTEFAAPGAYGDAQCSGQSDFVTIYGSNGSVQRRGGGGGGHATAGAPGGQVTNAGTTAVRQPGAASGSDALVPLRGGCSAGDVTGGGAIQLSARGTVTIDAAIYVTGGTLGQDQDRVMGGGGGGGILLEGAHVELGPNAVLHAGGGSGGRGEACSMASYCALGGSGATSNMSATAGGDIMWVDLQVMKSGGGGGGLGRIRINTPTSTYSTTSSSMIIGDVSTGQVSTR